MDQVLMVLGDSSASAAQLGVGGEGQKFALFATGYSGFMLALVLGFAAGSIAQALHSGWWAKDKMLDWDEMAARHDALRLEHVELQYRLYDTLRVQARGGPEADDCRAASEALLRRLAEEGRGFRPEEVVAVFSASLH